MEVTIERCRADDIDDVVEFIDTHWKRGHIFTTCRPLLEWQHRDGDGYSFVLARRSSDRTVLGVLGFIATDRFDPALGRDTVLWLTTWKVRDDAHVAGLGPQLLQFLMRAVPHRAIGALFPSQANAAIYRVMGFGVGEMTHYVHDDSARSAADSHLQWRQLISDHDYTALATGEWPDRVPCKTPEYFRRRYRLHPVYSYTVAALLDGDAVCGLLAARVAEHGDIRALRIVDVLATPDVFARIGSVIHGMLDSAGAGYADLYNAGLASDVLAAAGFRRVDPEGTAIVPDYFEPFEPRNVRLWYAFKGATNPLIFKGDADRDRPNVVAP